jgi:hypothetical protein
MPGLRIVAGDGRADDSQGTVPPVHAVRHRLAAGRRHSLKCSVAGDAPREHAPAISQQPFRKRGQERYRSGTEPSWFCVSCLRCSGSPNQSFSASETADAMRVGKGPSPHQAAATFTATVRPHARRSSVRDAPAVNALETDEPDPAGVQRDRHHRLRSTRRAMLCVNAYAAFGTGHDDASHFTCISRCGSALTIVRHDPH